MNEAIEDANYCLNIINNKLKSSRGIGKIYRNTNEDLKSIFNYYNFENKKVLSVMASGDQVFSCFYKNASLVDTFDANKLTLYYFYLKKWALLYTQNAYIPASNTLIKEIIKHHDNTEEEIKAYYFWTYILSNINSSLYYSELFYTEPICYKLPYENDIEQLSKIIKTKQANFKQINLFNKIDKIDKTYDIIILSNMLEYLYEEEYLEYQETVANNLNNLLNPNGIAISSNILNCNYQNNQIFNQYFEYEEGPIQKIPALYNSNVINNKPICYTYKKRP